MDFILIVSVLLGLFIYLIPAIVANSRGHNQTGSIVALNILFGWSLLGWGIALIWALSNNKRGDR